MNEREILINNLNKIHTTELGILRIKRNLKVDSDVVNYCKDKIINVNSTVVKKGKNFYITKDNLTITINSYSYTIITAHKIKD